MTTTDNHCVKTNVTNTVMTTVLKQMLLPETGVGLHPLYCKLRTVSI